MKAILPRYPNEYLALTLTAIVVVSYLAIWFRS